MTLTFEAIIRSAGVDPAELLAMRHAFVTMHEDSGMPGIHADSSDEEITAYTSRQSANPRVFPADPPSLWAVFMPEGGNRARLWSVMQNRGEIPNDGIERTFDLVESPHLAVLRDRRVIGWRSPRTWYLRGTTVADYPVVEIADSKSVPFPGFDHLLLDRPQLEAVMRERRYAAWRTALSSVLGIYLIIDTRNRKQYVGKVDGEESIRQRWSAYAAGGHGGNVELRGLDPTTFRYSILRIFDPATPSHVINEAESHFKNALDPRNHGLNRN